jgi:cellulose synthase/poly-beta-1,6-N-acetylglucosamine synthase-like glycosyltransferase
MSEIQENCAISDVRQAFNQWEQRKLAQVVSESAILTSPKPYLYLSIFGAWAASLLWFHPRLASLLTIADSPLKWVALAFFIVFTELAWLYAFYNVGVMIFATIYRKRHSAWMTLAQPLPLEPPAVAMLYTTCNDFVPASARSCVEQDYPVFTVYILDDSSDQEYQRRVDDFAAQYPERVRVVRRLDRRGFKAGNINHGLSEFATSEPLFALADADEILPRDFLRRMVPRILAVDKYGFVQANHQSNPNAPSRLAADMGVGINAHWRWYHPLRNRYGFVMLLGHGALLRRAAWKQIGGFPEIVSEDLAFALRIREHGWRGHFAEDIICYEDFPETIRAFRIRHMKWTRGTCEFLSKEMWPALRSSKIPLVEKLDVLFPTLNLPLALFYLIFVIDANLVLASLFGRLQPLTLTLHNTQIVLPTLRLDQSFGVVTGPDFFAITLLTLLAPVLCFIVEMWRHPLQLLRFLGKSTAIYGTLGPLSCVGVVLYALTGRAVFHVTADGSNHPKADAADKAQGRSWAGLKENSRRFLADSHPDHRAVQIFEVACGIVFALMSVGMLQISFLGLSIGFILLPVMHHVSWEQGLMRRLVYLPLVLIFAGLSLGGLSLFGVQTVLFGYGFHF